MCHRESLRLDTEGVLNPGSGRISGDTEVGLYNVHEFWGTTRSFLIKLKGCTKVQLCFTCQEFYFSLYSSFGYSDILVVLSVVSRHSDLPDPGKGIFRGRTYGPKFHFSHVLIGFGGLPDDNGFPLWGTHHGSYDFLLNKENVQKFLYKI